MAGVAELPQACFGLQCATQRLPQPCTKPLGVQIGCAACGACTICKCVLLPCWGTSAGHCWCSAPGLAYIAHACPRQPCPCMKPALQVTCALVSACGRRQGCCGSAAGRCLQQSSQLLLGHWACGRLCTELQVLSQLPVRRHGSAGAQLHHISLCRCPCPCVMFGCCPSKCTASIAAMQCRHWGSKCGRNTVPCAPEPRHKRLHSRAGAGRRRISMPSVQTDWR